MQPASKSEAAHANYANPNVQVDQLINQGHSFPKKWAGKQIMSVAICAIMCVFDVKASLSSFTP